MAEIANEEPYLDPDLMRHQIRKVEDGIWGEIDLGSNCSCVECLLSTRGPGIDTQY